MKRLIVGGNFGANTKQSTIVKEFAKFLFANCYNGGSLVDLQNHTRDVKNYDLTIWMPNVENFEEKIYPTKRKGSVLIVTKVLRNDSDNAIGDAVSRIFRMQGNAVIAISSVENPFKFTLIDALGNVWCSTTNLLELTKAVEKFYEWTSNSIRIGTRQLVSTKHPMLSSDIDEFCNVIKDVAKQVENERGGRYFGNASTRCEKMFPTVKVDNTIYVSKRNVEKYRIASDDFVRVINTPDIVLYEGPDKPSVDTPIQLSLYEKFDKIRFMIHGHAIIKNATSTDHYFPCGDMRELEQIVNKIEGNPTSFVLNLKNHGFLIAASTLNELKEIVKKISFEYKSITC